MVQDSTPDPEGCSTRPHGLTWKHVVQHAIGSLETISLRLIDRGQAGAVLGLLTTLGIMAVLFLVALRLPEEDIARAAVDLTRNVWALSSGILVATTVASLWTLRIHAQAMREDIEPLAKDERVRHRRRASSETEARPRVDGGRDRNPRTEE